MDHETKMIRQQMGITRTALTDKLEVLEQRVVDTVQGASSAVAETVENVKDIVHDGLQTIKDSAQDTLDTVKDAFDLKRQVDRRPWTMLAGATALGFLSGHLTRGSRAGNIVENGSCASTSPANGVGTGAVRNGVRAENHSATSDAMQGAGADDVSVTRGPKLSANLGHMFQPEISRLKGLAIGALLSIIRDVVVKAVPAPIEQKVGDAIDGITLKLGGQPIPGRFLPEGPDRKDSADEAGHARREQNGAGDLPPRVLKRA